MASLAPGLRRMALKLASPSFICRQCQRQQPQLRSTSRIVNMVRSHNFAKPARWSSTTSSVTAGVAAETRTAQGVAEEAAKAAKKAFPEKTTSKAVALWLLGSAVSVFGIVVWGGLTRLTESG